MSRTSASRATWQAVSVVGTAALLSVLRLTHPWFYLAYDKRNQYVPVLQDMGRRLRAGDFPAVDPNLGSGGNFSLDPQYGLFDPLHLAVATLLSFVDDPYLAGWLLTAPFVLGLGWGTTALLQRLGVTGVWGAAGGVAGATSGYVFFRLGFWWPGSVGAAFLPWFWWAWVGEARVRRLLAITLFAYLVVASGWPSAWMALGLVSVGLLVEAAARHDGPGCAPPQACVARAAAAAAGAAIGAVNVVAVARASHWTTRDLGVQNSYEHVVNWADALSFAMPYLHGDLFSHGGSPTVAAPLFFFGWFLLALVWMTGWHRGVWRERGVLTAGVALGLAMLSTQLPSDLGPVRLPSRQLAAVQFFAVVFVMLAWRASPSRLTVRRILGILATFAAMALVAWSRTPDDVEVLLGAGASLLALSVLIALCRLRGLAWAGAWTVVATLVLTAVAMFLQYPEGPARVTVHETGISMKAGEAPGLLMLPKRYAPESWLEEGVGAGFSSLSEDNRYAPGYSSVSQRHYDSRLHIRTPSGRTGSGGIPALFVREPSTHERWVDLLGYRVVVVHRSSVPAFERAAGESWEEVARTEHFVKLARSAATGSGVGRDAEPDGRVTAVLGDVDVNAKKIGAEQQTYDVVTRNGGRLVFRDLYWPGYVATLQGTPVPVTPFKGTLVSVTLPPGSYGDLLVRFRPMSPKALVATLGGGSLLLLLSMGLLTSARPSRKRKSGG